MSKKAALLLVFVYGAILMAVPAYALLTEMRGRESRRFLAEKIAHQIDGEVRAIRCDDFPQAVPTINGHGEYFRCLRDGTNFRFKFFPSLRAAQDYTPIQLITQWDPVAHRETVLYRNRDGQ